MAGAAPTKAELIVMLQNAVKILDETRKFGHVNAANLLDLEDTLIQSLELQAANAADLLNGQRTLRANLNAMLTPASIRAVLDPIFRAWGKLLGVPETDVPSIIRPRLSDQFITDADDVKTRDITFGAPAAGGGNVGDGELLRLTVDSDGEPIEAVYVETKTFEISETGGADANSGATRNREVFEVRGEDAEADEIERTGSGILTSLQLVDARNSIVSNAGFDLTPPGGIATPTSIPSWTSSVTVDSTNYEFSTTDFYQPKANENETRQSLEIKDFSAVLTQRLDLRRSTITPDVPYMAQIAYNKTIGSGDGTLTLKLGTATASVALGAAPAGWNVLRIALGAATSWLAGFNEDEIDVEISRTVGTTGSVHIDDLIVVPMTQIDSTWWAMVGGETPFLQGDIFTAADVFATTDSKIQHFLWRGYNLWLPSDALPTVTDPA